MKYLIESPYTIGNDVYSYFFRWLHKHIFILLLLLSFIILKYSIVKFNKLYDSIEYIFI